MAPGRDRDLLPLPLIQPESKGVWPPGVREFKAKPGT